ncbi:hypothetical protein LshimejAT787_0600600 [Lyophyllum shimeji]|uniref:Uncharacterized protein n=1 Tax=Lyophyllum shimeji TaxID=47721 RepID=A0A9P3PNX3_LYOSH|nr:hypothetical protein LshimejAT787_0600600 [Lyophyllum shimeji]
MLDRATLSSYHLLIPSIHVFLRRASTSAETHFDNVLHIIGRYVQVLYFHTTWGAITQICLLSVLLSPNCRSLVPRNVEFPYTIPRGLSHLQHLTTLHTRSIVVDDVGPLPHEERKTQNVDEPGYLVSLPASPLSLSRLRRCRIKSLKYGIPACRGLFGVAEEHLREIEIGFNLFSLRLDGHASISAAYETYKRSAAECYRVGLEILQTLPSQIEEFELRENAEPEDLRIVRPEEWRD